MSAEDRVAAAYARIAEVNRPEIWITLRPEDEVLADARAVDARVAAGEMLPMAGQLLAVKDNIDIAGLPTTAGCPAYAYVPAETAPAASRLLDAGAILVGKTNLDQFATGLTGTRSPYGAVRDFRNADRIAGGSSSGSAVAVALRLVDLALGTDTAGSGRVPAAFGGVVGLKPTYGLVPTRGVVPACRELDCVSVFATTVDAAERAASIMTGLDPLDPTVRSWPASRPLAASPSRRLAVPLPAQLGAMSASWCAAFRTARARFESLGATVKEIDITPFLTAGALLYGGSFVAARYAAVGAFVAGHRVDVDPIVGPIITAAAAVPASAWVTDTETLQHLRLQVDQVFAEVDALIVPTVSLQPTLAEVAADPIMVNTKLGLFTTFCNLLDLAAIAVPAGQVDGGEFGISVIVPGFHDRVAADISREFVGEAPLEAEPAGIPFVVVGAHMAGLPLNHQLAENGARLIGEVRTAPVYRMFALDTLPPKPGLQRVVHGGVAIVGELWDVPPTTLASLLATLPAPMALGPVVLDDGSLKVGFQCEAIATVGATDISSFGGWRAFLRWSGRADQLPSGS